MSERVEYDMGVVRGFAISALVWAAVGMLVGLLAAIQLAWPEANLPPYLENLVFAVGYNAIAVPLAVTGVLGPLGAALAMSLSSVVVTANAVRLLRWKPGA